MKIAFVYGNLYTWGGIQTWLIRMTRALAESGHEVSVLTRRRCEQWDVTTAIVDELSGHATLHMAGRYWFRRAASPEPALASPDVLFGCSLQSLVQAAQVQQRLAPAARMVAGVFHPQEFATSSLLSRRWVQHLGGHIGRALPAENFVFCGDVVARDTGAALGRDLSQSPVLPIPVDTRRLKPSPQRRVDPYKIASVARLARSYTHHWHMVHVIRELRDRGHPFTYHAYGDGEDRERLEAEARRLGVDDAVFFHGFVPYDRVADAIGDSLACIGLGTGIIEAAACGVPAIVGIDSSPRPATYGFIQEIQGTDVGGHVPGQAEYPIAERILWLSSRSPEQYRQVEAAARARAEDFGLDRLAPRFVEMLSRAAPHSYPITPADRTVGQLDWLLESTIIKLGGPDTMTRRFVRRLPADGR
jgi:glycosyltransferase involved in cell wall biosynthesis